MKKLLLMVGVLIILPSFASVSANVVCFRLYLERNDSNWWTMLFQVVLIMQQISGFYAGIWGSNVNFNDGAGSELDYYFGYGFEVAGVGVDLRLCSIWLSWKQHRTRFSRSCTRIINGRLRTYIRTWVKMEPLTTQKYHMPLVQ